MSIISTLKRIVDPIEARAEQAERKHQREEKKRALPSEPVRHTCRVCGYEGEEERFCPHCLADTMRKSTPGQKA